MSSTSRRLPGLGLSKARTSRLLGRVAYPRDPVMKLRAAAAGVLLLTIGGACASTAEVDSTSASPADVNPLQPVVSCMRERGFNAAIDPVDGALAGTYPSDQREIFQEALEECMSGAGLDTDAEKPTLSDADYERLFTAYVETAECLVAEGFEVSTPPSLQVFIESEGEAWHPYDVIAHDRSLSDSDWQRANRLCPQPSDFGE